MAVFLQQEKSFYIHIFFSLTNTLIKSFIKRKGNFMERIKRLNSFYKLSISAFAIFFCLAVIFNLVASGKAQPVYSARGSQGAEVEAIQRVLSDWGLFNAEITGYYGEKTEEAIIRFQRIKGLAQTGVADKATLQLLGVTIGQIPAATEANVNLLARIISAEGRGEPYIGQVAIGAVIMNRIQHPSFPDTLAGIIYENGAFTAITDGQFNEPVAESAYSAARDALSGWDPTGGCIYYYNPAKTNDSFIKSRTVYKVIGAHYFCV